MSGSKISSENGSTAIGGNVSAPIVNVRTGSDSAVNVSIQQSINRQLPTFLGKVIVVFSTQSLANYADGQKRALLPEATIKLQYNNLSPEHRLLVDYYRHSLELEQAYLGVEQYNADARYLVRRKAGIVYESLVNGACKQNLKSTRIEYVRANADQIIEGVIDHLLSDYTESAETKVEHEIAHLAISLVVVDSIVECEVLEIFVVRQSNSRDQQALPMPANASDAARECPF